MKSQKKRALRQMNKEREPGGINPEKAAGQNERPPRSKNWVRAMEGAGVGLLALGFLTFLMPAFLSDENGHYETPWLFIAAGIALLVAALAALLWVLPDALVLEFETKQKKLEGAALTALPRADKARLGQLLARLGFEETPGGLYRKRERAALKDGFWLYIALEDITSLADACDAFTCRLKAEQDHPAPVCLIAFLYKPGVTQEDRQILKALASSTVSMERTLGGLASFDQLLPVLVDASTGQGLYLSEAKGASLYAYGSRFLKKQLQ